MEVNKIKIAFFVFVLASILDIVGIIFSIPLLIYIFKPLIIFSLLFLYVFSLPKRIKWYVIALELSFFGDVLLLFSGELFFMGGLVGNAEVIERLVKVVLGKVTIGNGGRERMADARESENADRKDAVKVGGHADAGFPTEHVRER